MIESHTKDPVDRDIEEVLEKIIAEDIERCVGNGLTINWADYVFEEDREAEVLPEAGELSLEVAKNPELEVESQDSLEEVNLGTEGNKRITYVSKKLTGEGYGRIVEVLKEYRDCFAWEYNELPGLDRSLVEHKLPIKSGCKPVKQLPRKMTPEVTSKVKEEIERLLNAGFIRTARYVEWVSNVVPVMKKNGKLRVCIDYRSLNSATPKDEYSMPVVDLLVDRSAGHSIISTMDGHSGYNQIWIAEDDVHKTAFRGPGSIGTFEWVKMPFGLKNAGATYQRAMNAIFHDLIGTFLECYIDDIIVKSDGIDNHIEHLRKSFDRMRSFKLKLNPLKCAFGVSAGNFLGYVVHKKGIQIDKNKAQAIIQSKPPSNKKELQRFLGQVNFLRRFISNAAGKTKVFSPFLKLNDHAQLSWEEKHQQAFEGLKKYLSTPPVLMPPKDDRPMKLYISAAETSIGVLLAQDNDERKEQAVFYLSRFLNSAECNYSFVEKLCLALYFAAMKLRYYLLPREVYVISNYDLIKYMLTKPILRNRIGKWVLAMSEFSLTYVPQKAVKGQALADFLADHPNQEESQETCEIGAITSTPWKLWFDGSRTEVGAGIGFVIESPEKVTTKHGYKLESIECTNNQVEYEALIMGLEALHAMKAKNVEVFGDSQLVINQLLGEYKCVHHGLVQYFEVAVILLSKFDTVSLVHISRYLNQEANDLAQHASGFRLLETHLEDLCWSSYRRSLPMLKDRAPLLEVDDIDVHDDWRKPLIEYLTGSNSNSDRVTRLRSVNYVMYSGTLFKRCADGLLLECLSKEK